MIQRVDTIETVVDVFNIAMDIQELYLKQGPFKQLSMSEMHVLEAVDKESSPSMSAVANHLNVTLGTLTTAVKKIVLLKINKSRKRSFESSWTISSWIRLYL